MLGAFPAAWKKHFPFRHTLTKTPILPVRSPPLRETDSLILNPSLLTSPSQGLSRSLHPEGREALQSKDDPYRLSHMLLDMHYILYYCRLACILFTIL